MHHLTECLRVEERPYEGVDLQFFAREKCGSMQADDRFR